MLLPCCEGENLNRTERRILKESEVLNQGYNIKRNENRCIESLHSNQYIRVVEGELTFEQERVAFH